VIGADLLCLFVNFREPNPVAVRPAFTFSRSSVLYPDLETGFGRANIYVSPHKVIVSPTLGFVKVLLVSRTFYEDFAC
jgi:hypothetical protein